MQQKKNKKTRVDELSTMRANIVFRRTSLSLKQTELAAKAGIQAAYVSMIENGVKVPTIATLSKIAHALDTSAAALLTPDFFSDTSVDTD